MDGLCKKGRANEALKQWDVMEGHGLEPTDFTFSILLNCLCHASRIAYAIHLLEWSASSKCHAGAVAYNTVMSRLCEMGRWKRVLKLLTDMIKRGVTPNTRAFNIVIRALCSGGKLSIARGVVRNPGVSANVVTYNTLIHYWFHYCRDLHEVWRLISDMAAEKIAPDEVTCTTIVHGLCRDGKYDTATRNY
uniref:Pentatricopeptide repeat-containing protein n=1 Tax=Aegilops tauschii subsp. strangulata TaxID=200361 RepID=A0A453JL00_AEGTS